MPFKNPEKRREYKRKWYAENQKKEFSTIKKRKAKIRKWFKDYKTQLSCSKCGESHPAIIDFHPNGKKENQVAQKVHFGYSIKNILKEINKCQVLCANCHRKLHYPKGKL